MYQNLHYKWQLNKAKKCSTKEELMDYRISVKKNLQNIYGMIGKGTDVKEVMCCEKKIERVIAFVDRLFIKLTV